MEIESIVDIIEKSELIKALYNVQVIGSINGVSGAGGRKTTFLTKC